MASHKCVFCGDTFRLNGDTYRKKIFDYYSTPYTESIQYVPGHGALAIEYYRCPNDDCRKISIHIQSLDKLIPDLNRWIYPDHLLKQLPDYVPVQIRQDFDEACKILELSPKASATLSRRALQGMIRDYWKEVRQNLHQEIEAISDRIEPDEYEALMSLKSIGNIGAHPNQDINLIIDVEPSESLQLIELIELFVDDWYIKSHNKAIKLKRVKEISESKEVVASDILENHE